MKTFSTAPTRALLDGLGCPDKKLKIIHIAGTNGKGSVAEFFTRILIAAGFRTGTYTSPEVYSFYDQFRIDGKNFTPGLYNKYYEKALALSVGASPFEIQTAAAIAAFAGENCEWVVIECGMGGRDDATNAIAQKQLAVITSVSLEHTSYLGDTIPKICAAKSGIIRDCPAVIHSVQPPEAREYFKGCRFADKIEEIYGGGFKYDGKRYSLRAKGVYQPHNAACAIEGARILKIDESAIEEGIALCLPRGRLEEFYLNGRVYVLDGAHNPAAFIPLRKYLTSRTGKRTVIFGCLKDKDIEGNLSNIVADEIIAVECPSERTRSLEDIVGHCRALFGKKRVAAADGVRDALDRADGGTVCVCGSFTLLSEAEKWIEKKQ